MAAAVISSFIAGATISAMYFTNDQIKDGYSHSRQSTLRVVVSDQLRKSARSAYYAGLPGEDPVTLNTNDPYPGSPTVLEIYLYGYNQTRLSAYRLSGQYLWEGAPADDGTWNWSRFKVGSDSASVDMTGSGFKILPKRRGLEFTLQFRRETDGVLLPLVAEKNMFRTPLP